MKNLVPRETVFPRLFCFLHLFVVLFLLSACGEERGYQASNRKGIVLAEKNAEGGIIKGITQVSISPSGKYFILSNRNSGTSLLYDRGGNQIAIVAPPFALTDSFVINRYKDFPKIDLQKISEWTDQGRAVDDSVKREWLKHAYFSAAFDSDTTYKVLAWIDNVEPPPSNSFTKFPALLYFKIPNQLYRVQPVKVALKSGIAAASGQDMIYNPNNALYYTECHNDSLGRVVVCIDRAGVTRFVIGDQPEDHISNPVLSYNLYSIHLASFGSRIAYVISTEPYIYMCDSSAGTTEAIKLNTSCDNTNFFRALKSRPSMDGIQSNLSQLKLSVANISQVGKDTLIVVWSCSNGKTGEERVNQWNYCYFRFPDKTLSDNFNISTPPGCKVRYVQYDEHGRQLMVFATCSDETWRVLYVPIR